ncbi:MAG: hypothetical protein LBP76_12750, partial [Treponema sp.]|nr:hypothetical protein [Treponema sp.]
MRNRTFARFGRSDPARQDGRRDRAKNEKWCLTPFCEAETLGREAETLGREAETLGREAETLGREAETLGREAET